MTTPHLYLPGLCEHLPQTLEHLEGQVAGRKPLLVHAEIVLVA